MGRDRRRYPRVGVTLDIVMRTGGREWPGRTVDLSPFGVKVALPVGAPKPDRGARLEIRFALPDGTAPLSLAASVVRIDRDGVALNFVEPEESEFKHLKDFVDLLLENLGEGAARLAVSVRPVKERRRGPRVDAALPVSFEAEKPYDWRGKTVNLSPFGVKVDLPASAIRPAEGTSVRLRLDTPDPIRIKGMVWRREPKATALIFVDLAREEIERLRALVEALRAQPA